MDSSKLENSSPREESPKKQLQNESENSLLNYEVFERNESKKEEGKNEISDQKDKK